MSRKTAGGAMLGVLGLMVLLFPLVASLFVRSHAAVQWVMKLHYYQQATALAEEGEATAYRRLEAGGLVGTRGSGDRLIPEGGMEYRILSLGTVAGGQALYLVAAEGLYQFEERMVVSVVEVSTAAGVRLLIPRDRTWLVPRVDGGPPITDAELADQHRQKVDGYLAQLAQESAMDPAVFLNAMARQTNGTTGTPGGPGTDGLDCTELQQPAVWTAISAALSSAKAPPPP